MDIQKTVHLSMTFARYVDNMTAIYGEEGLNKIQDLFNIIEKQRLARDAVLEADAAAAASLQNMDVKASDKKDVEASDKKDVKKDVKADVKVTRTTYHSAHLTHIGKTFSWVHLDHEPWGNGREFNIPMYYNNVDGIKRGYAIDDGKIQKCYRVYVAVKRSEKNGRFYVTHIRNRDKTMLPTIKISSKYRRCLGDFV